MKEKGREKAKRRSTSGEEKLHSRNIQETKTKNQTH